MPKWEQQVLAATMEIVDDGGRRIGSGVLIDGERVLTAAHVVNEKGQLSPKVLVRSTDGTLYEGSPIVPGSTDIAVISFTGTLRPSPTTSVALAAPERKLPKHVRILGFPSSDRTLKGVWRSFRVGGPIGTSGEYRQLDWEDATGSFKGHSGGPVVDATSGEMVGVLTEGSEKGSFDRFLCIRAISDNVRELHTQWVFVGEEAREHVTRRAHGHLSNDSRGGDFFIGREAALAKVERWVETEYQVGRPLVITGQPGAGKSAVLGRAALARAACGSQAGLLFHARSATYSQFLDAVREVVDVDVDEDALSGLRQRIPQRGLTVMVDALDEAATRRDAEQIASTLASMAGVPGVAVIVATRPGTINSPHTPGTFLALLNAPSPQAPSLIDLDSAPYFDREALAAFASNLLVQNGVKDPYPADGAWPYYRQNRKVTDRLAKTIASRAGTNYLVTALTAIPLSENLPVMDPDALDFDFKQLPTKLGEALTKVIDRQSEPTARLTRGLLTALAHAEGSGISDELWLSFSNALHYDVRPADLRDLKDSSFADFLLQVSTEETGRVTRLFHQALTDELVGPDPDRADEVAVYQALLSYVQEHGGWAGANDYALAHAFTHARKAGQLAELLADTDALSHCDPASLTSAILEDPRVQESSVARAAIRAASHLSRLPPGQERLALLTLIGAHLGLVLPFDPPAGWTVIWAHDLGQAHQQFWTKQQWLGIPAIAVGQLIGRDVIAAAGNDGTVVLWDAYGVPIGNPLTGFQKPVSAVAIGRLGARDVIVAGGHDGTVRLWDDHGVSIGNPLKGHRYPVRGVALGRLGGRDLIVSAGDDETVRLWDEHGAPIGNPLRGHSGQVMTVAMGRLGGRDVIVSAGTDKTVRLWDEHGAPIGNPLQGHEKALMTVAIGHLGGRDVIVSAGTDETVRLWDEHGAPIGEPWECHQGWVWGVTVGRLAGRDVVVSAGENSTIRLWDENGVPIGSPLIGHQGWVSTVAVARLAGRDVVISAGFDGTVRRWDEHGVPVGNSPVGHQGRVFAVAMGRLGGRDVIVSAGADKTVRLWDEHGAPIGNPLEGHSGQVKAVAMGRLGGRDVIVSAGADKAVRLWDEHGAPIGNPLEGHSGRVFAVAMGRLGGRDVIVSAGADNTVRLWDEHGAPIGNPLEGHQHTVQAVAIGRLGDQDVVVSAGTDKAIRLWDENGAPIGSPLKGHKDRVSTVAVHRLGGQDVIVSAGDDGTVRLWDKHGVPVGNPLTLLSEIPALALNESALTVATGHAIANFKWT